MTVRYSWWGAEDRAERINKTIALFEKKCPKIKVRTDFQPYADFWKKFNTQASRGNPPDVFQNAIGFLRKSDAKNVLLDPGQQVEAGELSMDGFRAGLEKFGEIDGQLLEVPVGSNSMVWSSTSPSTPAPASGPNRAGRGTTSTRRWRRSAREPAGPGTVGCTASCTSATLYLRRNGKAPFFTEDGLGFTEADLTAWWTEVERGVESGLFADAAKVAQIKPRAAPSAEPAGRLRVPLGQLHRPLHLRG